MPKILLVGDVHLSDKAPSSCTESYTDDLFDLLYQVYDVARDQSVEAVVQAGDLFHVKRADRNSHRLVQRALEWARQAPCPLVVVPGNHDMAFDKYASIFETQPLGVLARAGVVEIIDEWSWGALDHLPLYGVPWQQEWSDDAVVHALWKYTHPEAPGLVVTHAPLFPPGQEPPYEYYPVSNFVSAMGTGKGSVYYGHIHDRHGEYSVDGVNLCNNGALSRGSLTESNLTREVGVTIWDQGQFEFIPLNYKPASEVFRLTEITDAKVVQAELDGFLASVGEVSIQMDSMESIVDEVRSRDLEPELIQKIEWLIREAWSE